MKNSVESPEKMDGWSKRRYSVDGNIGESATPSRRQGGMLGGPLGSDRVKYRYASK